MALPARGHKLVARYRVEGDAAFEPNNEQNRTLMQVRSVLDVSRHHMERTTGFEPATLTLAR